MHQVIGCVPYVNAKPLVDRFHFERTSEIEVIYDIPSRLPALLDSGSASAVLASSFEALNTHGRTIAAGCSISTWGAAESVRLFSKVRPAEIRSLALDQSSLTSNNLARVLLKELYDADPSVLAMEPDLEAMLARHDACILIGDIGMRADGTGLHIIDLGEAWFQMTGLPFVWAVWIGGPELQPELVRELVEAKRWGREHLEEVVLRSADRAGWPIDQCDHYLRQVMNYDLSLSHVDGLRRFQELLLTHGLLVEDEFPTIIESTPAAQTVG